jgi:hypothetical protein
MAGWGQAYNKSEAVYLRRPRKGITQYSAYQNVELRRFSGLQKRISLFYVGVRLYKYSFL